ncbi:MAG: hypothetical protein IPO92_22780 [Saprospiraceae bacterium]|nr:hypothetical protein [Saprospiraceae bacterium]
MIIIKKNEVYDKYFGIISLSIGLLVPWSFLPNKIIKEGWGSSMVDLAIMTIITLVIYLAAFKFGAFKNKDKERLKITLAEWEDMESNMDDNIL